MGRQIRAYQGRKKRKGLPKRHGDHRVVEMGTHRKGAKNAKEKSSGK
jgi:hypothetical protein